MTATTRLDLGNGVSTRLLDTGGDGTPVVLVHGLAASIEIWEPIIPALAERHRVVAFDLPGWGEADKPADAPYRALWYVDQVRAVVDAVGIDSAHWVGSSMGASLVVRYAHRHRGTVETATLCNPGGFGRFIHPFLRVPTIPVIGTVMSRPMRSTNRFGVRLAMADKANATKELIDLADRQSRQAGQHRVFVHTLRGLATPFRVKDLDEFEEEARAADYPTLVVWGRSDRIFPPKQTETAAEFMPAARIEILDRCGHYPQIERPGRLVELIEEHLATTAAEPGLS